MCSTFLHHVLLIVHFMFIEQLFNDHETVCVGHILEALCFLCPFENLLLL